MNWLRLLLNVSRTSHNQQTEIWEIVIIHYFIYEDFHVTWYLHVTQEVKRAYWFLRSELSKYSQNTLWNHSDGKWHIKKCNMSTFRIQYIFCFGIYYFRHIPECMIFLPGIICNYYNLFTLGLFSYTSFYYERYTCFVFYSPYLNNANLLARILA